jgi:hypothetical protein
MTKSRHRANTVKQYLGTSGVTFGVTFLTLYLIACSVPILCTPEIPFYCLLQPRLRQFQ